MATIKPPSTTASKLVDVEAQVDPDEDAGTRRLRNIERTLWTRIWQGVAIATVVFNILAMVWTWGAAPALAGIIAIPISAAVFYYQFEIQDTDSLRKVQNDLRHKVNGFADANMELSNNTGRLEEKLAPLKETEQRLSSIAEKNGSTVNKLRDLVKENHKIQNEQKKLINDDIVQDMMEAVLNSERSEDGHFSDREIKRLVMRLKGLPAIIINEELLMAKLQKNRSISSVLDAMKTISDDSIPDDERIFKTTETGNSA